MYHLVSSVAYCLQRTNYPNLKTDTFFMTIYGALKNSTLQKHYNLTYFSHNIFFNVKITLLEKWSMV